MIVELNEVYQHPLSEENIHRYSWSNIMLRGKDCSNRSERLHEQRSAVDKPLFINLLDLEITIKINIFN